MSKLLKKMPPAERLRLFEKNDEALIKRLSGIARGRGSHEAAERALRVFEAFLFGTSTLKDSIPETDQWPEFMNTTIKRDLDHLSLLHFVAMVLEFHDGAAQAERRAAWHATDPKQAAKAEVKECWKLWKAEPARYKNRTKFAKDMLEKFTDLESERVIATKWIPAWEAEGIAPEG